MRVCADMLLIASHEHLQVIDSSETEQSFPGLATCPCQPDEPIPALLLGSAQIIVVEVDPANPRSLDRLRTIGRDFPGVPRIAAISNTTVALVQALVREGVNDVVALPFQLEELLDVSLRALAEARARKTGVVKLAPQVAFIRSVGGCGASSIATHVGSYLAGILPGPQPVAMVDLDLQGGSIADYLGVSGAGTLAELLAAGDRIDEELLRSVARSTEANLVVFATPNEIMPIESADTDRVLQLLTLMRQNYSTVLIDLPTDWTNWAVSAVSASDLIVMVVELNVNSLRQAKRRLELLANVGIEPDRVVLVVNRVEKKMFRALDLSDVTETLKREVIGTMALEGHDLASAQAQGLLVDSINRKSKFAADAAALGEVIARRIGVVSE